MRIVFIGNHTTGVQTLKTLMKYGEVVGVVAHPPDPEDGVCYESVFDFAKENGLSVIRLSGKDPNLEGFVRSLKPDLVWVTDYRYLLPPSVFNIPPLGAVNLHGSLLPKYRGRAVNNWAIINGETKLGLTAHFIDEGADTGDIIDQVSYELSEDEDAGDALNKLYPLFSQITEKVMKHFLSGKVPRIKQDESEATEYPRRTAKDGIINWNKPARSVMNLVRAVARPYPGAFTFLNDKKLVIWKSRVEEEEDGELGDPGKVTKVDEDGTFIVTCSAGSLCVLEATIDDSPAKVSVGDILTDSPS